MRNFAIWFFLLLSAGTAKAFNPEECSVLLKSGIYDEYKVLDVTQKFSKIKDAYCGKRSAKSGFSIPIDLPVEGSASFDENVCTSSENEQYESYFFYMLQKTINKDVINGFNDCLKINALGVTYVVYTTSSPEMFNVNFSFMPPRKLTRDTVRVIVQGAVCISPELDKPTKDGKRFQFTIDSGGFELLCQRQKKEQVVNISASAVATPVNTKSIYIPAWTAPKPKPSTYKFYSPIAKVGGLPLDMCAAWAASCDASGINGKPAADLWCHRIGLGDATEVKIITDTPPTQIISDYKECRVGTCDRISQVTCAVQ